MRLRQLIQDLPEASVFGPVNRDVRGIACQALRVGTDMLYVALPEGGRDVWQDTDEAVSRGASAVMCERETLVSRRATRIQVPDIREALARAAAAYYGRPSATMQVIGVMGGTDAKVMASLLHSILQAAGRKAGIITSAQHQAGDASLPRWPYRPQSLDIQQSLAHMVVEGCATCVVEIPPDEGEHKQFLGVEFDLRIRADMTGSRTDPFPWEISERKSSASIHKFKEWDKRKAAVINIDAVFGSRFSRDWAPAVQLTDGTPVPSLLHAGQLHLGLHGSRFVVSLPDRSCDCRLPSLYLEDVYNALGALHAARVMGLPTRAIEEGFRGHPGVPGRLEPVRMGQPFEVLVDGARSAEALTTALLTVKRVCSGRVLLLVGSREGMSQRDRLAVGEVAARLADHTVFTADNPGRESPLKIAADLQRGFEAARYEGAEIVLDRQQAIRRILALAEANDCVILAGKGDETIQELDGTVLPFDDRTQARTALDSMGFDGNAE